MKRSRFKHARKYRRRRSISASNWGPVLLLTGAILAALAVIGVILYILIPKAAEFIGWDYRAPFVPEPTPAPTPVPTPTPHPIVYYNFSTNTQEVVFDGSSDYKWFADPYIYSGKLILSAGKLDASDSKVHLREMYFYDSVTRTAEKIDLRPQNTHFMFPKFNSKWLVYLDANLDGGGALMAVDLTAGSLSPVKIKDIYTGQPEPMLDGDYVAFFDRTGTKKDKLFVCDLSTMETTVVEMFTNSVYGQGKPSLCNGLLMWADSATSDSDSETSVLNNIQINSSTIDSINVGMFAHDPECNGTEVAWLTDVHSPDTALYAMDTLTDTPFLVDRGVVEFGLGPNFIAYSRNEGIYVYMFETGAIYRVTAEYELSQFLGVSDGCVIWMDVTSRERDIVKFAKIP